MTLFEESARRQLDRHAPLASRMRPRSFDEFVGQDEIIGPGRVLRRSIEADRVPSIILWGPPGTGKTTLATLVAGVTKSHFSAISAVASGVADLRKIAAEARERLGLHGQRTILFVDEIHRFNKAQQDVVLPHVENGTVVLIGATTENPSFEVVSPLLSRSRVFALKPLSLEQIEQIVRRAIDDNERGLGSLNVELDEEAMDLLLRLCNSDARTALNALELAASATEPDPQGIRRITPSTVEDAMQKRSAVYDKGGDHHYDTISAFIKSVRGSDPDASVYWLARMIEAGEDPMFLARRLVILAAEDIGMADPHALSVAVAAQQAVHFVGMPEGRIPLAEATVYLATAPKSNSAYMAISEAPGRCPQDGQRARTRSTSATLSQGLMRDMGYGRGYKYSHDYEGNFEPMENLPPSLRGRRYYRPGDQGYEKEVAERLRRWWDSQPPGLATAPVASCSGGSGGQSNRLPVLKGGIGMLDRVVSGGSVGVACGASVGVVLGTLAGLTHLMLDGIGKYPGITIAGGVGIGMVVGTPTGAHSRRVSWGGGAITSARAAPRCSPAPPSARLVGLSLGFFVESTISMLAGASISVRSRRGGWYWRRTLEPVYRAAALSRIA